MNQDRRVFIEKSIKLCAFTAVVGVLGNTLTSCTATKVVNVNIEKNNTVSLDASVLNAEQRFVKVRNLSIPYDILLYINEENKYESIYMKCSHQDNPVYFDGKKINCPTHGSSFDKNGKVLNGPANQDLTKLKTEILNNKIIISLK